MTPGDGVDNAEDDTESESDESNDSEERESDQDCVVIGAMETVFAHEESDSTSGNAAKHVDSQTCRTCLGTQTFSDATSSPRF